jgi:hypothetical protein
MGNQIAGDKIQGLGVEAKDAEMIVMPRPKAVHFFSIE